MSVAVVFATSVVRPFVSVMRCTVSVGAAFSNEWTSCRMRVVSPPLRTTLPPPSIDVSLSTGAASGLVTVIVCSAAPQLNVTMPPRVTAVRSTASVHDAGVPVPTTEVGVVTSTSATGETHLAAGRGGTPPSPGAPASTSPPSGVVVPPSPPGPPPSVPPPLSFEPELPHPADRTRTSRKIRRMRQ